MIPCRSSQRQSDNISVLMLRPIGFIESCYREKFGTPRQGALVPRAPARLRIRPEFIPEQSLVGLERVQPCLAPVPVPPQHQQGLPLQDPSAAPAGRNHRGLRLALAAPAQPHRPDLGAPEDASRATRCVLEGVDLVNSTPILDIKPYIPACDRPARPRMGWVDRWRAPRLKVEFTKSALADLGGSCPPAAGPRSSA